MKTDREAAKDYAKNMWGHLEGSTIDIMQHCFEAGCKHKEESRWIPVIELPENKDYVWVLNKFDEVVLGFYSRIRKEWVNEQGDGILWPIKYQLIFKPTPPQTNK